MAVTTRTGPFAIRPADTLIEETHEPGHELKRSVGALDLTALGVGAIIGTGIFIVVGVGVAEAGPAVILSFCLAAVACIFSALCYAELAASIPVSGSAYTYSYATMGEIIAWIIGWDLILEYTGAVAAVSVGWGASFNEFLDNAFGFTIPDAVSKSPEDGGVVNLVAVAVVLGVMALLARGTRESAKVNLAMVAIKLAVLTFFIIVAFTIFESDNLSPFAPEGFDGIVTGASIIFFAYIGFDAVATGSEETRNPGRDMPIAIVGSLTLCTIIYILVAVAAVGALPAAELAESDAPLAEALDAGAGISWAASLTAFGAVVAITSVILAMFYGQTRIFFAMARDGLVPEGLADVSPRTGTPLKLTVGFGVVMAVLAALVPLSELVKLVNIGTLFAFLLVNIGVIVLRRTRPDLPRTFRVPLVPFVPLLGAALVLYLMLDLPGFTWARFFIWMAIGLLIYFIYGYRNSRLRRELTSPGPPNPGQGTGSSGAPRA
jgi:basic amino acid/polyamine antiporter, APA family